MVRFCLGPVLMLFLIPFWLIPSSGRAQATEDFQTWNNVGVAAPLDKKTTIAVKYILGLADNSRRFERSMLSLQADRDFKKWLRVGAEYRFGTEYTRDFHRIWLYTILEKKLSKKFELQYRLLFQYDVVYLNAEYMQEYPSWPVVRNMLKLKYQYNKRTQFYTYADVYSRYRREEIQPYRFRYGAGFSYLYKKRHDLGAELVRIDEFNRSNPEDVVFVNTKYIYHIIPKKKKKKKVIFVPIY